MLVGIVMLLERVWLEQWDTEESIHSECYKLISGIMFYAQHGPQWGGSSIRTLDHPV